MNDDTEPLASPAELPPDLDDPALYLNRELSWLEFNRRVLAQALDETVPVLERLRYLTISSTNLDEFFEVRVAGLKQKQAYGVARTGPDSMTAEEQLAKVSVVAHGLVAEQYRILNEVLLPALGRERIHVVKRSAWTKVQRDWIARYFRSEVLGVLTPVGLDPSHPFPKVLNKGLNFFVSMDGDDAFGRSSGVAVVQVPRSLPRLIALPDDICEGPHTFVLLSSVVHAHIGEAFPGMAIKGCHQFRVTRNSDLWVDTEEVDDLLDALKGELPHRRFGDAVRLEVADNCPDDSARFLLQRFGLSQADLFQVNGPVNLHRMAALIGAVERPDLKFQPFIARTPPRLAQGASILAAIREGDVLLHHPFESFQPVVELVRQAAADPKVLAIKMTLYRSSDSSPLIEALYEAAVRGKEVTAVVELRARFDEAANIQKATRLQEAGANVVYGVVGYKTHAKMLLIVRREEAGLRRYVHLGTGNYHDGTARLYTDVGHMTCDPEVGEDVHRLFLSLTGMGRPPQLTRLIQSPFNLREEVIRRIEREADHARAGRPARIIARMNSLSELTVIQALYRASQAGVKVDLVIRGLCRLRPGVPGVSDNITVRSIIGRFLEHSRVWYVSNGDEPELWCSSADWMYRNLYRRVELAWPVTAPELRQRLLDECLLAYLEDDFQAWELNSDGHYLRLEPEGEEPRCAQEALMAGVGS